MSSQVPRRRAGIPARAAVSPLVLNSISILALLFMAFCLFSYSGVNRKINKANNERFELTYNANRFMNGSSYLTNEVRAMRQPENRSIMIITGTR